MKPDEIMIVLACEVFRLEIEWLLDKMDSPPPVQFLEMGLHQRPDKLRETVQAAVDEFEEQNGDGGTILLAYGLCGQGLSGVTTQFSTLILPKVHDCIPLLLGIDQDDSGEYSQNGATYWQSPGWVNYADSELIRNKERFHAEYVEKYGADNADYLMEQQLSWLRNYNAVTLIRWPQLAQIEKGYAREGGFFEAQARCFAKEADLPYQECSGSDNYLSALLEGGKDKSRFLHIKPGKIVTLTPAGTLESVEVK
ncbi:DUF1638 domain-containing protein [Desulforhopalus sp. 52FAK]